MRTASVNMTEGDILRNIAGFAVPVLIGNIFQQMYNVADTAIIGNILGDSALAAVGAAAPVYNLMIGFAGGLTNGFSVITARYFGAGDDKNLRKSATLTYVLSAVTAVILTLAALLTISPLAAALRTPADIITDTTAYLRIIMMFSAVTIAYNMLAGMMRAVGNSHAPLYFLIISTFINIALDILFVKVFGLGIPGAAYATVISQMISVLLCFLYTSKKCRFLLFGKKYLSFDRRLLNDLITTGISMGLMYAIVSVGSLILQSAVNSFGKETIAAHTAARKIDDIFMMPLGTISMASSTFASQNFGARKYERVKQGIRCGITISIGWSVFSALIAVIFRMPMITMLTGTSDTLIINTASRYIIWNICFFPVLSFLLVLRSSLQGVGRKLVPICGSVVEFLLKIAAVFVLAPKLGYFGICILEPAIWAVCAVIVIADYLAFAKHFGIAAEQPAV